MRVTVFFMIFLLLSYSPVIHSVSNEEDTYLRPVCDTLGLNDDQCYIADKVLTFVGYGGLAVAAGTYGVPFVLAKLGFTATGVVGGSLAASWQTTGVAQGVFAAIQSTSMTGTAAATTTKLGLLFAGAKSYLSSCNTKTSSNLKHCNKQQKC